jgi:glutamate carboxypeptidase
MIGDELLARLTSRTAEMLAALQSYVEHETPSRDKPALDRLVPTIAKRLHQVGAAVEVIDNPRGGNHASARWDCGAGAHRKPGLVLCHYDTVWPIGTLAAQPFHIKGDRAYGPGVFDMKASLVLAEFALEALHACGVPLTRPVEILITSDEEIGSPTSRGLIEDAARNAAYVLVPEAPLPGGKLKTARKGVGHLQITVEGKSAHAGVEPEKGVNAIIELAHQIIRVQELADPAAGTTINVGVIHGGTTSNVVPARAVAHVDVRVTSRAEADRITRAFESLTPINEGARVRGAGSFDRPPMERSAGIATLFEQAREIGRLAGLELGEGSTGGASDGNFTAALGVPTLDGLGALGDGAHAEGEHIVINSLPTRAALLALLLSKLEPEARNGR